MAYLASTTVQITSFTVLFMTLRIVNSMLMGLFRLLQLEVRADGSFQTKNMTANLEIHTFKLLWNAPRGLNIPPSTTELQPRIDRLAEHR